MKQKYVIFKHGNVEDVVIFSELMSHDDIGRRIDRPLISAGFMQIYPESEYLSGLKISCFGESVSLKLKSRGQVDADVIKRMMFQD